MLTGQYARMMASYNRWQNENLLAAAETLPPQVRDADLGAFFHSIRGTLSHLLWADQMWLSRFTTAPRPNVGIAQSPDMIRDWQDLRAARQDADAAIVAWAKTLPDGLLSGDLRWFSGANNTEMARPLAHVVAHFFNHQTHHRGQIHAMLTRAGAKPGVTDLAFIPENLIAD